MTPNKYTKIHAHSYAEGYKDGKKMKESTVLKWVAVNFITVALFIIAVIIGVELN